MSNQAVRNSIILVAPFVLATSANAQSSSIPDPSNPEAEVPATIYTSLIPQAEVSSVGRLDQPKFPWSELYLPGGEFVPESTFDGGGSSQVMSDETMMSGGQMSHGDMGHGDDSDMAMSSASSDAQGIIQKIYHDDGKVKLKHGPIDKLGMPGMTMIFYLKDPALMEGLSVGDEVGFDVELDGTTFYITGFEK